MLYISVFFLLLASSFFATHWLIRYATKNQLLDIANHRSSHTQATPRIGGIGFAIIMSMLLAFYGVFFADSSFNALIYMLFPCALVAATGLVDDIKGLSQATRFLLYLASSAVALGNLDFFSELPVWLSLCLSAIVAIALSWWINLFNFMDGIDGIAASQAIFILGALSFFFYQVNMPSLALLSIFLIAPISGFLVLNWHPAKIFMGDIGSTFLGCLTGCLLLQAVNTGTINIWAATILLASFATDATWTLAYRITSGQRWHQAHRSHCYQILSRKFGSHQTATLSFAAVNVGWLFPLALAANNHPSQALLITTISLLPLIALCFIIGAGKSTSN